MSCDNFLLVSFVLFLAVAIINLMILATRTLWEEYRETSALVALRLGIAVLMALWALGLLLRNP
jgi:uncharacterized membrane protein YqjE